MTKAVIDDPRPDLEDDSRTWEQLLARVWIAEGEQPGGALEALHNVRCEGARLTRRANGVLRIEPGADYLGKWEEDKVHLEPHREAIGAWLRELGR
jgi:hypothetical protein